MNPTKEKGMTADNYAAAIRSNVDAMYSDHITMAQFSQNQQRLWDEIARDDTTHHNVQALLRGDQDDIKDHMMDIDIQILQGNLDMDDYEATDEDADLLVEMTEQALAKAYPDAEISIDLQRRCSGATRPTAVYSDPDSDISEDAILDAVTTIEQEVFEAWAEKITE